MTPFAQATSVAFGPPCQRLKSTSLPTTTTSPTLSQSLANVLIHLVFSTKQRRPLLADPGLRDQMHRYLAGICKKLQCPAIRVGGTA
jgi:hypothetical protein